MQPLVRSMINLETEEDYQMSQNVNPFYEQDETIKDCYI